MIGTALLLQSDRLIAATWGDPTDLAVIAVVLPPFAAGQSLLGAAGSYLWPHYADRLARGDLDGATLTKHFAICAAVGGCLAVAFVALMPVYLLIIGYSPIPWAATCALGLFLFGQALTLVPSSMLTRSGSLRWQGGIGVSGGLMKVVFSALAVGSLGAAGMIGASAVVVLAFQLPAYWRLANRLLRDPNFNDARA